MTLKRKLLIINLLMILIPAVIFLISTRNFLEGTGIQYGESLEALLKDSNRMYSAQGFLHAYWEEIKEQKDFPDKVEITKRMRNIEWRMEQIGYHFFFEIEDGERIGNLSEEEKEILSESEDGTQYRTTMTEENDGTVIVIQTMEKAGTTVRCAAIHVPSNILTGHDIGIWGIALRYLFWMLALAGCSILFSNLYLSYWIRKNILKPLQELSFGSHKIKNGDFDYKIGNEKQDEIGEVCRDFDAMSMQLKEAEEARIKYEKDRAELFAGISHDLRSPLTSIKGYAEGLLEGIANTPEKRNKYYRAIHLRAHDMEYLSNRLGDYMSLETGKNRFQMLRLELNQYLRDYIEKYTGMEIINQGVEVKFSLSEEPLMVELDEEQMYRVFDNIIQNSIKYRVHETVHILIETKRMETMAFIKIVDDGDGVPEEKLPYIFDCFYRADSSRTKPEKGSGLGLSIVKQIIVGHNGIIKAENDGGLAILIWLPIAEAGEEKDEKDIDR